MLDLHITITNKLSQILVEFINHQYFNNMKPSIADRIHTLWIQNKCLKKECCLSQLYVELEKNGLNYVENEDRNTLYALVIFDEISCYDDILEILGQMSQKDLKTILVYLGEDKLPFYQLWELLNSGAEDIIIDRVFTKIASAISLRLERWETIEAIMQSHKVGNIAIGYSKIWKKTLRQVIDSAYFSQNNILLMGETGTGKELIARIIHELDQRKGKKDFVILDCTTIVSSLSGSEFFGHEKGSFTNAISTREGVFALANEGTLFLDEIGELPLPLQAELLRVIQEGSFKRVGSNQWRKTNFRLICATNRDLKYEVEQGRFRADLYYRISASIYSLPVLRDRCEDIITLAEYFLKEALRLDYTPVLDSYLRNYLYLHSFPGNVRELRQLIYRIAARYPGEGPVTLGCIPETDRNMMPNPKAWQEKELHTAIRLALANGVNLKEIKHIAADIAMDIAIEESNHNVHAAAKRLDISDRVVQLHQANKKSENYH